MTLTNDPLLSLFLAVISILIALILYPVCFANELTYGKDD